MINVHLYNQTKNKYNDCSKHNPMVTTCQKATNSPTRNNTQHKTLANTKKILSHPRRLGQMTNEAQ